MSRFSSRALALSSILLCLPLLAQAKPGKKKAEPVPAPAPEPEPPKSMFEHLSTEPFVGSLQISRHRLSANGLEVLLVADPSAPTFSYHTYFDVGSGEEKEGQTGIAHLFEHLMFKGTDQYADGHFSQVIEEAGGGDLNAWTWLDITAYHVSLPKDKLAMIVQLESARMDGLVLDETQLNAEREVVINERRFRVDNDPDGKINEQLWALAFEKNTYHWPTIGWQKDLDALTVDNLKQFYRDYYAPNNARVVVVGDIDPAATLALIEQHYKDIPASQLSRVPHGDEPTQDALRRKEMALPIQAETFQLGVKAPALSHADWPVLAIIDAILSGGNSARFQRRLIDSGWAADVGTFVPVFQHESLYEITATMRPGKSADAALQVVLSELASLRDSAVSSEELERARNQVLAGSWSELVSNSGRAGFIGFNELAAGGWKKGLDRLTALEQVSAEDVARVAKEWLVEARASVVVGRPEGQKPIAWKPKDLPKAAEAGVALKPLAARPLEGAPQQKVGEVVERSSGGWTRLLVYDPTLPLVWFQLVLPVGSGVEPAPKAGLANVTAELLLRGTVDRNRDAFERTLEGLGASVEAVVDVDSIALSGSCPSENWPKVAALIAESLQNPAFAQADFDDLVDEIKAGIVDDRENDMALARSFFARSLHGGTAYGRPVVGTTKTLSAITRDDVALFYRTWFGTQGAVLGLLGAFDAGAGGDLAKIAGQLPGTATEVPRVDRAAPPEGRKVLIVDKPARTQVQFVLGHHAPDMADEGYAALWLANEAFGSGFGAVLMQEIREKRGWSYGAYSSLRHSRDADSFVMNWFPATSYAADCLTLGLDLFGKLQAEGIDDAQLKYARSSILNGAAFYTDTGAKRLGYEIRKRIVGHDPLALLPAVERATIDEVRAATGALLHPANLRIVVVATATDLRSKLEAAFGKDAVSVVPFDQE